jgi:ketosteroid isomerase-like protein
MKNLLAIGLMCLLCFSLAIGQESSKARSTEDQITKLEKAWAQALVKNDAAALDQYEADDIVNTDPGGRVNDKAQDKKDLSSGDVKFESLDIKDIKVRVYGNAAVATGTNDVKASTKGQDVSGAYRFTDTWVKRNGKWQCVASQVTKIQAQ